MGVITAGLKTGGDGGGSLPPVHKPLVMSAPTVGDECAKRSSPPVQVSNRW